MERFGRYVLLEKLASGGMGEVFRAAAVGSAGFARPIAIKRILPHLAAETDFVTMLVDEAKLSATLMHQNIVQVLDLGKQDGLYFIAMDFVAGQPLNRMLASAIRTKQAVPPDVATFMVHQALGGLAHAHEKRDALGRPMGIIHRDISPQNILVGFDGSVKLADFGIAKAAERSTVTTTGTLKGKPGYVAPEQVLGNPCDQRLDLYAMGVVLYETLCLRRLRKGENDMQVLMQAASGAYVPLGEHMPDLPRELVDLVDRALAKEPADRFQSAREFADALHAFRRSQGWDAQQVGVSALMLSLFPAEVERERQADVRFGELIGQLSLAAENEISGILEQMSGQPGTGTGFETPISVRKTGAVGAGGKAAKGRSSWPLVLGGMAAVVALGSGAAVLLKGGSGGAPGVPTPQPVAVEPGPAGTPPVKAAVLVVETTPPGARVKVGGKAQPSPTPLVVRELGAGPLEVDVELPGYAPVRRVVDVAAGAKESLKVTLEPLPVDVPVTSTPPGAVVLLDGAPVGNTPMTVKVPPGQHPLRVEAPGFVPRVMVVDAAAPPKELAVVLTAEKAPDKAADKPADRAADRAPDRPADRPRTRSGKSAPRGEGGGGSEETAGSPGTLDLMSQPWGRVYVDGKDTGRFTPVVGLEVAAGTHTVRMVNQELGVAAEARVTVKPGATVQVSRELK